MALHIIAIKLLSVLIQRSPYLRSVCTSTWRRRLRKLDRTSLLKKLKFLINHADARILVKCHNKDLFNDPDVHRIVYEEIVQRGLREADYVKDIINSYTERRGK